MVSNSSLRIDTLLFLTVPRFLLLYFGTVFGRLATPGNSFLELNIITFHLYAR